MDLTSKKTIKSLLKEHQARPSKRLGQNFLVSKSALKKTIETAGLSPKDIVLEIGPGLGTLTQELAKQAKKVIAVEKDPKMCEILKENVRMWGRKNVRIIQEDILKIENDSTSQLLNDYKIVANLPFYLTAPVIRKFLEAETPPQIMALIVQKEVAQRICAKPPKMSILAVSVQFYAEPKIISFISKESFWPQPEVNGAILRIVPLNNTDRKLVDINLFFKIVKAGFAHPRKQLANNLSNGLKLTKDKTKKWMEENEIQPSQRAETLSIKDWKNLTKSFSQYVKKT
ncbi:MAG: ribosomal RNA small subunit methyltransferase A [Nanoarchaeota archaeon]|nr:ribosomal RNA small subunit methyltransferase A [Nanoarchaeota archaeon]